MTGPRLAREVIAMRVAKELPDGACVNLGIGIPTLVSQFMPEGRAVVYHSESGVLNYGPLAGEGEEDIDLINAGGQFLAPSPGMAFFHSADAFAMIAEGMGAVGVTVTAPEEIAPALKRARELNADGKTVLLDVHTRFEDRRSPRDG